MLFGSAAVARRCPAGILISALGVSAESCERDCERWLVARTTRAEPSDALVRLPAPYGIEIEGMESRVEAARLTAGSYRVAGELGCFVEGELWGAAVIGEFEVRPDGSVVSAGE